VRFKKQRNVTQSPHPIRGKSAGADGVAEETGEDLRQRASLRAALQKS